MWSQCVTLSSNCEEEEEEGIKEEVAEEERECERKRDFGTVVVFSLISFNIFWPGTKDGTM